MTSSMVEHAPVSSTNGVREVPVDWEALEDAFENNAPEVHSYLQLTTGDVLRVVDGVADPQMHARISSDPTYLRIDPVSSREQYRWMERYIPMVDEPELRAKLAGSIDGKGAFRRFKDVLMSYAAERERWFAFRSERLRIFMEAWLEAHALCAIARPAYPTDAAPEGAQPPSGDPREGVAANEVREQRRARPTPEAMRKTLRELAEALGPRDLDTLVGFADFLRARRATRGFAHHAELHHLSELGAEPRHARPDLPADLASSPAPLHGEAAPDSEREEPA